MKRLIIAVFAVGGIGLGATDAASCSCIESYESAVDAARNADYVSAGKAMSVVSVDIPDDFLC